MTKQLNKADYVNAEMVDKIEKIEDEMMNPKPWEMVGEAMAKDRPVNSLLEVHLDFNAATKLPPVITKETTNQIESLIKQRILDELFDDPVLKAASKRKKIGDDQEMDFSKSKKGLGDMYAEDLTKRLASINPETFLESELAGPDGPLKREIEESSKDLFQILEILCNFHYTPRAPKTEVTISTQNVPSLMLEDALPINVSKGQTKSAREMFAVNALAMRDKSELSKQDRRKERASRKRQIKQSLKAKAIFKKEKMRESGIAMAEKFAVKDA
jgi:U3 small nucleolar RNA-associated protein MPP10